MMRPTLAALHPQHMPMPQPPVQQPPAPKPVYKAPPPAETQAENMKVCFGVFENFPIIEPGVAFMNSML